MNPTDEVLARQAAMRDRQAFTELVRRHQRRVLMLQERLVGDCALAEDLTQETFLRAWRKLRTYRGTGPFAGWLASIAYNVFRAHWRRSPSRKETPFAEADCPDGVGVQEATASPALQAQTGGDLRRLLACLDPQDQILLVLNYGFELTSTEIGAALNVPVGTVKARIHRAKAKIRKAFAIEPEGPVAEPHAGVETPDHLPQPACGGSPA